MWHKATIYSPCRCTDREITVSVCLGRDERGHYLDIEDVPEYCPVGHPIDQELLSEAVHDLHDPRYAT